MHCYTVPRPICRGFVMSAMLYGSPAHLPGISNVYAPTQSCVRRMFSMVWLAGGLSLGVGTCTPPGPIRNSGTPSAPRPSHLQLRWGGASWGPGDVGLRNGRNIHPRITWVGAASSYLARVAGPAKQAGSPVLTYPNFSPHIIRCVATRPRGEE